MIKVLLERRVEKKNLKKVVAKINQLRTLALSQPGYVSGETYFKGEDPVDVLVIATWVNEESWEEWTASEEHIVLNDSINKLTVGESQVGVFYTPSWVTTIYE